jgi:hypothetical protein
MRCRYEGAGMISLQAYLCIYSFLNGVTFGIVPISSYAISPMILSLLKTCPSALAVEFLNSEVVPLFCNIRTNYAPL